jgi:hypothetical protein
MEIGTSWSNVTSGTYLLLPVVLLIIDFFLGRWVMLFNANLDRSPSTRKSKTELREELNKWEDGKTKKKKTAVDDGISYEVT